MIKSIEIKKTVIVISSMTITVFYYFSDPASFRFGLPCLFHATTGWDCWGCGGQRAFHQLLHGNFQEAFYLNALVFPVVPVLVYVVTSELFQQKTSPYKFFQKKPVQISSAMILVPFTILRNVME